jgi:ABC-type transport system involved in cytochrome bd biosynthesis fused ATPase/permease subunit
MDEIDLRGSREFLHWAANAGSATLDPGKDFSQGQLQDLALALFLARARGLGGTFFLDEPVAHLDDMNRVGLLDVLRAVASTRLNLVITTASRSLARPPYDRIVRGRPCWRILVWQATAASGDRAPGQLTRRDQPVHRLPCPGLGH